MVACAGLEGRPALDRRVPDAARRKLSNNRFDRGPE
jgi:hypothetical protein